MIIFSIILASIFILYALCMWFCSFDNKPLVKTALPKAIHELPPISELKGQNIVEFNGKSPCCIYMKHSLYVMILQGKVVLDNLDGDDVSVKIIDPSLNLIHCSGCNTITNLVK